MLLRELPKQELSEISLLRMALYYEILCKVPRLQMKRIA
jgi:hypothetical protein